MNLRIVFSILALFAAAAIVGAAELDPALETALGAADGNSEFSVIAKLYNPRDVHALDIELHERRAPLAERHLLVVQALKLNAAETQGPVLNRLDAWKQDGLVTGFTAYWIENLIVVQGRAAAILALASDPAVESIGYNFDAELIEPVARGPIRPIYPGSLDTENIARGQIAIGAPRVNRELGFTGEGTIVAGIDTGVDGNHPALAARWRGTVAPASECWLNLLGGTIPNPTDNNGHGTHTMGTMCGRAINGNDTLTVGSAPDAMWIATNPIDQGVNPGFTQDILDALEWLTDPDGDSTTTEDLPDVIQNSWGVTTGHVGTHCYNNWNTAIQNCEAAGPVIVWSAGNEGYGGTPQSLRSPATYELTETTVFSVGAVDLSNDTIPPFPIADFSSRGPSGCAPNTAAIKPEIVAPGVNVLSCIPGGGYSSNYSGTSMSGPHVAGVVALMREACPNCDHITIKEALINTAIDSGFGAPGQDNSFGYGFIDAYNAVLEVASVGRVHGYVLESDGDSLAGVNVSIVGGSRSAVTGANGYYRLTVSEGTQTIRFSKFGYQSVDVPNIEVAAGDTLELNATLADAPQGVVAGHVILQSGVGVEGAEVIFRNTPIDTCVTDANGYFVQAIPATSYSVRVRVRVPLTPPQIITRDTTLTVQVGDTTHATLIVFVNQVEPAGPDAYGYSAYDRYDRTLPAPAEWVEINPALGFGGRPWVWQNEDSAQYFPAPFPIRFYGQARDTLTVSVNGWMLPGVHHLSGEANNRIPDSPPNPNDPPGIIAPYWDDFNSNPPLGEMQFSYLDTAAGRWIFQLNYQRLISPTGRLHSWQVHFLDPAFHPTLTADCDIVFIYGRVAWLWDCTIGIENPDETTGIQILHNSVRDSTVWPISNEGGNAIRFSTGRGTNYGSATVSLTLNPPPEPTSNVAVMLGGRLIERNANGQFVGDSIPAVRVSGVLMGDYEPARVDYVQITAGQNNPVTIGPAWRMDPPRDLTWRQVGGEVTLRWRQPESVAAYPYPALRYNIIRNDTLHYTTADTFFVDDILPDQTEWIYRVEAVYRTGRTRSTPLIVVQVDLDADEPASAVPTVFALYPNYPNPFNPETRIRLDVPARTEGRLEVYDIQGRLVRTLWSGELNAGRFEYRWDSRDNGGMPVATGLYLCRFVSPAYTATQKMLLVK